MLVGIFDVDLDERVPFMSSNRCLHSLYGAEASSLGGDGMSFGYLGLDSLGFQLSGFQDLAFSLLCQVLGCFES